MADRLVACFVRSVGGLSAMMSLQRRMHPSQMLTTRVQTVTTGSPCFSRGTPVSGLRSRGRDRRVRCRHAAGHEDHR
jgi:hypothetical protein